IWHERAHARSVVGKRDADCKTQRPSFVWQANFQGFELPSARDPVACFRMVRESLGPPRSPVDLFLRDQRSDGLRDQIAGSGRPLIRARYRGWFGGESILRTELLPVRLRLPATGAGLLSRTLLSAAQLLGSVLPALLHLLRGGAGATLRCRHTAALRRRR